MVRVRAIVALPFGLVVGSFLTVVVDRVPKKGVDCLPAVALSALRSRDQQPR